ncbi:MAG: RsiV family protein [Turicibacter sanguinis]
MVINYSSIEDENEFKSIADNQTFYINSSGDVVVVFDKYSIAPGYMGFPEFTIHSSSLPTTGR